MIIDHKPSRIGKRRLVLDQLLSSRMSLSFTTMSEREKIPLADLTMFHANIFAKNQLEWTKEVDRGNGEDDDDVDGNNGDDDDDEDIVDTHARYPLSVCHVVIRPQRKILVISSKPPSSLDIPYFS